MNNLTNINITHEQLSALIHRMNSARRKQQLKYYLVMLVGFVVLWLALIIMFPKLCFDILWPALIIMLPKLCFDIIYTMLRNIFVAIKVFAAIYRKHTLSTY